MKRIGIISVLGTKNKSALKRLLKPTELGEIFGENPQYTVIGIHSSALVSKRRVKSLFLRTEKRLKKMGMDLVVHTDECKALAKRFGLGELCVREKNTKIPADCLCSCFLNYYDKVDKEHKYEILDIYDKELDAVDFDSLSKLCMSVRYIRLYTKETDRAKELADMIFNEYGVWIDIKKEHSEKSIPSILIDVNRRMIRIVDFVIDGAEFTGDSGGYNIDFSEVCDENSGKCELEIKKFLSGKNSIK